MRPLRPAALNLVAQRKPLESLLRLRPLVPVIPLPDPADPSDAEWQRLARLPNLWFVRRRQLAYRDDLAGVALRFAAAEDGTAVDRVRERLEGLGLATNLDRVLTAASPAATAEVTRLLDSPRFADSPALTAAALGELSARAESAGAIDTAAAVAVTSSLTAAGAGEGLTRLEVERDRTTRGARARPPGDGHRVANGRHRLAHGRTRGAAHGRDPIARRGARSAAGQTVAPSLVGEEAVGGKGSRKRKKAGERT